VALLSSVHQDRHGLRQETRDQQSRGSARSPLGQIADTDLRSLVGAAIWKTNVSCGSVISRVRSELRSILSKETPSIVIFQSFVGSGSRRRKRRRINDDFPLRISACFATNVIDLKCEAYLPVLPIKPTFSPARIDRLMSRNAKFSVSLSFFSFYSSSKLFLWLAGVRRTRINPNNTQSWEKHNKACSGFSIIGPAKGVGIETWVESEYFDICGILLGEN